LCNPVLVEKEKERKLVIYFLFYCGFTSFSYHGLRINRTLHSPTNKQSLSSCAWLHVFNIPQQMNGNRCTAIIITVYIDVVIFNSRFNLIEVCSTQSWSRAFTDSIIKSNDNRTIQRPNHNCRIPSSNTINIASVIIFTVS
jgi:hypothetical protein